MPAHESGLTVCAAVSQEATLPTCRTSQPTAIGYSRGNNDVLWYSLESSLWSHFYVTDGPSSIYVCTSDLSFCWLNQQLATWTVVKPIQLELQSKIDIHMQLGVGTT